MSIKQIFYYLIKYENHNTFYKTNKQRKKKLKRALVIFTGQLLHLGIIQFSIVLAVTDMYGD